MSFASNLAILKQQAARMGVSDSVYNYLASAMHQESSGNEHAQAQINPHTGKPFSSAKGLFGFLDGTWREVCSNMGLDASKRFDPTTQCQAAIALATDQARQLEKILGHAPSKGDLYLSHFTGMGGARAVLTAEPSALVGNVLGHDVVEANHNIKFRNKYFAQWTVQDLRDWADAKMNVNMSEREKYQSRRDQGLTTKEEDETELNERKRIAKQFGFSDEAAEKLAGGWLGKIFLSILKLLVGDAQTNQEKIAEEQTNADLSGNKSPNITKSKVASVGIKLS